MPRSISSLVAFTLSATLLAACSDGNDNRTANNPCQGTETGTTRLFLQQLTDTEVILKWRGPKIV